MPLIDEPSLLVCASAIFFPVGPRSAPTYRALWACLCEPGSHWLPQMTYCLDEEPTPTSEWAEPRTIYGIEEDGWIPKMLSNNLIVTTGEAPPPGHSVVLNSLAACQGRCTQHSSAGPEVRADWLPVEWDSG